MSDRTEWNDRVAKAIVAVRLHAGLRQVQLARAVGVSQPTVSYWEQGRGLPSLECWWRLCDVLPPLRGFHPEDSLAVLLRDWEAIHGPLLELHKTIQPYVEKATRRMEVVVESMRLQEIEYARLAAACERAPAEQPQSKRACRECQCTDDDCSQCIEASGHPCYWVAEDLCSRCGDRELLDLLWLVGKAAAAADLRGWTADERRQAEEYAVASRLEAAGDIVEVPAMPAHVSALCDRARGPDA